MWRCVDIGFPFNNFCRDALILLKVCSRIYHCKIQAMFDIGNHPHFWHKLWPFFDLVFVVGIKYKVKILFLLNNF